MSTIRTCIKYVFIYLPYIALMSEDFSIFKPLFEISLLIGQLGNSDEAVGIPVAVALRNWNTFPVLKELG